ncbi:MAG TPA: SDR family NAD(P)-dependent oxidoreductase [Allosphingosinicella sp.]
MVSTSIRRFEGKVVLITGGTSGIGLALAEAFLAEGASVAVCGLDGDKARAFQAKHRGTLALSGDIADPNFQMALLGSVAGRFGRLDILVNNAGRLIERDFVKQPPGADAIAGELHLNLVAPVQLTSHALFRWPCLEALVFISSGYALVSPRRAPTYGAAKAGLHGFAEGMRRQLEPQGIHVLEVLPPVVDTPATAHREVRKVSPEDVADATLDALAARRPTALIGATRLLPALLRLAPGTMKRIVSGT